MNKRNAQEQCHYAYVKQEMYQRDDWRCRNCNSRQNLTPHHVVYQSHGGKDELNNLLCLCMRCHNALHAGRLRIEVVEVLATDLNVKFWRVEKKHNANL